MQRHLNTLRALALDSGMSVNLDKTKVMKFNTTSQWFRRSAQTFTYGEKIVEYTESYTYLGVVFNSPMLSFKSAANTRLTRAITALGRMEKMCSQIQFQEPHTKLWLFDTQVTPLMLYGVQDHHSRTGSIEQWRCIEKPLSP